MDLDKIIKERHSVRSFKTTKKVDYKNVIAVIEAGSKAPLAGNMAAVKFILVSDKAKILELAEASQQDFIGTVDFVIVVCSDKDTLEKSYDERGKMYARQQAGAAIENMMLKITQLGLATCWIGAFSDVMVKRTLKIPDEIDVEALLPVGFELGKGKQQLKPSLDRILYFDFWKNKYMKPKNMAPGFQT